jgi:hypothetical protein
VEELAGFTGILSEVFFYRSGAGQHKKLRKYWPKILFSTNPHGKTS